MVTSFETTDHDSYTMDYRDPHRDLEPPAVEIDVVDRALAALREAGAIDLVAYNREKFLRHRQAVRDCFDIPWTAITPRMQRLLYALNAISRPKVMVAAGVFCGNTFISNAGAAVGPGAGYRAEDLVGIEIKPEEAARAEANVRALDPTGTARVVAADAVDYVRDYPHPIDVLYLDADGDRERGKGIYLEILTSAWEKMPQGALILAHNSVNCAERLARYLAFVRDPANCKASVNVVFDREGLEVSAKGCS